MSAPSEDQIHLFNGPGVYRSLQELSLPATQELREVALAKVSQQELDRLANYWPRSSQEFEITGGTGLPLAQEFRGVLRRRC